MIRCEARLTVDPPDMSATVSWSWDLDTLRHDRRITVPGTADDGRPIAITMEQVGGFISIVFDAASKDVPLNSALFAKHCRVKLARLKSGKLFVQTFSWEDPTGTEFLTVRIRLHVAPEDILG